VLADDRRVRLGDLQALKELLGESSIGFHWLMGFSTAIPLGAKNPERARAEVPAAVQSLLARLYYSDPDLNVLPKMPTPQAVYNRAKRSYKRITGTELSWRRFVLLCGLSQYSSHGWKVGEVPTMGAQRVLLLLDMLLTRRGDSGLRLYLRTVENEAKARGFASLQELYTRGNWGRSNGTSANDQPRVPRKVVAKRTRRARTSSRAKAR
jgi:hypothetical protein